MPLNHVGITVGNLNHGIRFYTEVCGLELIGGPDVQDAASDAAATARRREIFGPAFEGSKVAHLVDPSGVGVELFEFPRPEAVPLPDELQFWRIGVFHVAVTVDDMDTARARLEELGGMARTAVYPLQSGRQICYCKDPWGNAIELSTHAYPDLVAVASPTSVRT